MSCIKNEIVQKYIDGEASPDEVARVEYHIAGCETCAAKVNSQRKLVSGIKKVMNPDREFNMETPAFDTNTFPPRKTVYTIKRLAYELSAACLLVITLIVSQNKLSNLKTEITTITPGFAEEIDANQPVTKQNMVITIIGPDGSVTEYFN
jgi:predicted anti-sigma-YlaC factor YlaD